MKNLNRYLPTFAADYTGASHIVYEMDGMVVFFDGRACACHAAASDEPRLALGPQLAFSVNLKLVEAVTGDDRKQIKKILNALEFFEPKFLTLVGTPVPAVIGTDLDGIAAVIEKKSGIPCVGVNTTGFDPYDKGASKTMLKLAKKFIGRDYFEAKPCDVNVLGTLACDMWDVDSVQYLERCILESGAESVCCWGADARIEEIAGADRSKLNVVTSVCGLETAKYLEKTYGTPYVVGFPVGDKAMGEFKSSVAKILKGEGAAEPTHTDKKHSKHQKVLVIAEQLQANGIRNCLQNEYDVERVDCITFFDQDKSFAAANDKKLRDEDALTDYVQENGPYDLIIGDPVVVPVIAGSGREVIAWPHFAISGIIHMRSSFQSLGEFGTRFFDYVLQDQPVETE